MSTYTCSSNNLTKLLVDRIEIREGLFRYSLDKRPILGNAESSLIKGWPVNLMTGLQRGTQSLI